MNKIDFITNVKNLISRASLDIALEILEENISIFDKNLYVDVVMLKTQYIAGKNDYLIRGIVERSDYDRIVARINFAVLDIIDRIERDKKFEKNRNSGKLLYKIPQRMTLNSETRCCVRVAYLEDIIKKNLELDNETNIQSVKVTEIMNVGLVDMNNPNVFQVRTATDEEQFIIKEDYTEWLFWVKPVKVGCFVLLLKLAVVELINEKERKHNIVLEKEINIITEAVDNSKIGFEESKYAFMFLVTSKFGDTSKGKLEKGIPLGKIIVFLGLFAVLIYGLISITPSKKNTLSDRNLYLNRLQTPKNVLADIRARDEIRIIVESDAEPFNFIDEKGDTLGFDFEIAKAIAKELGISKITMMHMNAEQLAYSEFPSALNRGIADCFMGGYVKDFALGNLVLWSNSYYEENGLALIVKASSKIDNASQLKGKKVAVYDDALPIEFVEKSLGGMVKPCIDTLGNRTWIEKELDSLGADAVVYNYPFAMSELLNLDPSCEKYKIAEYNLLKMPVVIGLPKGNDDLLQEVNYAIHQLLSNEAWYGDLIKRTIPAPICVRSVPRQYRELTHVVKKGETLSDIVHSNLGWAGYRWHEVWEWNKSRIPNPYLIYPGNEIQLVPPHQ